MKKIALIIAATFAMIFLVSACSHFKGVPGSGVRKTEQRDLKSFKAIDTSGAYEIAVTCQKPDSVQVEADDNILPLIKTEVRDGVLYVSAERGYNMSKPVKLLITLSDLGNIATHGAGQISVSDVKNDKIEFKSTGAASITASGQTKTVNIESTGAGEIDTSNLRAQMATVRVTGAASVDVFASEQLDANVSGAGSVTYAGNPKTVNKSVSGIGSVNKKGEDSGT
jgi:hypothetical protein